MTLGAGITAEAGSAEASQFKGAVVGTVTDQGGAAVGNATVQVSGSSGASQSFTADGQGNYAATDLAAGTYTVTVTLSGFQTSVTVAARGPG